MTRPRKTPRLEPGRMRALLRYEPETGIFRWLGRSTPNARVRAEDQAGYVRPDGYRCVVIDSIAYLAHRLAWFYMTGAWPTAEIDHRNGSKDDNSWINLRHVAHQLNTQNRRSHEKGNLVGLLGVDIKQGKYRAQIVSAGKKLHLGYFTNRADAHQAYLVAKRALHEGNTL